MISENIWIRKEAFARWKERMTSSDLFQKSNRKGINLSYCAFMTAWNLAQLTLLRAIINDTENEGIVNNNIYTKLYEIQEEVLTYEKVQTNIQSN